MTIKKALELARQNGYVGPEDPLCFLEPTFFQSLGKALGWEKWSCGDCYAPQSKTYPHHETDECINCLANRDRTELETWKMQWYQFIDHLAEGKTEEDYFKSL